MPQFQFHGYDQSRQQRSGTIEAANQQDAVARLAAQGLAVQQIIPLMQSAPMSNSPPPIKSIQQPAGRGGMLGLFFANAIAILALLVASGGVAWSVLRDPLGSGLSKYDFSSPAEALESRMLIDRDRDLKALLELDRLTAADEMQEALDTLEIEQRSDFEDKKILFVKYKQNGETVFELETFEEDEGSGYWLPVYLSPYDVEESDPELAEQMRNWRDYGRLTTMSDSLGGNGEAVD